MLALTSGKAIGNFISGKSSSSFHKMNRRILQNHKENFLKTSREFFKKIKMIFQKLQVEFGKHQIIV